MIDITRVTNFNRTDSQLEEFLLVCICVAGKNGRVQTKKVDQFLNLFPTLKDLSPFELIRTLSVDYLYAALQKVGMGQYDKIVKSFRQVAHSYIDLRNCSPDILEKIHGVGPKTSRFFIVHSRKDVQYAVLDTHILRYMREELNITTPLATPNKKLYANLERKFLEHVKYSGRELAELDLEIWNKYSLNRKKKK